MLVKYVTLLFSSLVLMGSSVAEGSDQLKLGDRIYNEDQSKDIDFITWRPLVDGLSRFTLVLPPSEISDALKYDDTSSLFYMARTEDHGLKISASEGTRLNVYYGPSETALSYKTSINRKLSFTLGASANNQDLTPEADLKPNASFEYRTIGGSLNLDRFTSYFFEDTTQVVWSRTSLIEHERSEVLQTLGLGTDGIIAGIGMRFFEPFNNYDASAELRYTDSNFAMHGQIERPFSRGVGYLASSTNLNSGKTAISIGIKFSLSEIVNTELSTQRPSELFTLPTLRNLRRSTLPEFWRTRISVTENDSPIYEKP